MAQLAKIRESMIRDNLSTASGLIGDAGAALTRGDQLAGLAALAVAAEELWRAATILRADAVAAGISNERILAALKL